MGIRGLVPGSGFIKSLFSGLSFTGHRTHGLEFGHMTIPLQKGGQEIQSVFQEVISTVKRGDFPAEKEWRGLLGAG